MVESVTSSYWSYGLKVIHGIGQSIDDVDCPRRASIQSRTLYDLKMWAQVLCVCR